MTSEEIMKMAIESIGLEPKVFDWDKAATILRDRNARTADAGLVEDWGCTADCILKDGVPYNGSMAFLASTWATPVLLVEGNAIECWRMAHETPDWDAMTIWPESAEKIFFGGKYNEQSDS